MGIGKGIVYGAIGVGVGLGVGAALGYVGGWASAELAQWIDKWPVIGPRIYVTSDVKNTIKAVETGGGALAGAIKLGAAGFVLGLNGEYEILGKEITL